MRASLAIRKLLEDYDFQTTLDIGSGNGEHAKIFREAGREVYEVDLKQGTDFNEMNFSEQYDCVWCSHVLEHQLDTHSFLKKVHSVLKEGGVLVVTVPPMKHQIVGGHVSLWNAGLLLYRLVLAGFNCVNAKVLEYDYNISVIVEKKSIEIPQLKYDSEDIATIKDFLPLGIVFNQDSFNGNLHEINWKEKKVVFWGYKYPDMKGTWKMQAIWLANAFAEEGFVVVRHPTFICEGFPGRVYDHTIDNPCDIVIYNHTDISEIVGEVIKADKTLFMKPTVPDEIHTSLDPLGYGPFSSIAYMQPDFNGTSQAIIDKFFETKVQKWISNKVTKWPTFENKTQAIKEKDYFLIIGQCEGDETTKRFDFGSHTSRLMAIVNELNRISDRKIIVKLHPYMDGLNAKDTSFSDSVAKQIRMSNPGVSVYNGKINIHSFIENAYCVILANSGAGYEAMMHHKPIIAWGHPEYHWIAYDLRHLADLTRAIKLDWFNREKQDQFLYWFLEKYCYYDQGSANRKVKELIQ